jgi:hypothetical protein
MNIYFALLDQCSISNSIRFKSVQLSGASALAMGLTGVFHCRRYRPIPPRRCGSGPLMVPWRGASREAEDVAATTASTTLRRLRLFTATAEYDKGNCDNEYGERWLESTSSSAAPAPASSSSAAATVIVTLPPHGMDKSLPRLQMPSTPPWLPVRLRAGTIETITNA